MPTMYTQALLYEVVNHIRNVGLQVTFRPEEPSLDGQRIVIPAAMEANARQAIFLSLHLAGHSVQWRDSAKSRGLAMVDVDSFPFLSVEEKCEVIEYELMGTVIGLLLLPIDIRAKIGQDMMDDAQADVEMLIRVYGAPPELVAKVAEIRSKLNISGYVGKSGNFIRWNRLSGTRIL